MNAKERQNRIMDMVRNKGHLRTEDIASAFDVSRETVRKDLILLSESKHIIRVHGGVIWNSNGIERPPDQRIRTNQKEKTEIARKASRFIRSGDTVFVDGGSTVFYMLEHLQEFEDLTVVTNALAVVERLRGMKNIRLIMVGGVYRENGESFVGHLAENQLRKMRVPKIFLTCEGIDTEEGIMDGNEDEGRIKRCALERVTAIITDSALPRQTQHLYRSRGVDIIV